MPDVIPFFIEYDKAQAEWVVVAYEADDPNMIAAVEQGQDVHAWTAHLMSGVPISEIKFEDKALDKETRDGEIAKLRAEKVFPHCPNLAKATWLPRNMALRQAGKKSNHALNYDEGVFKFAQVNGMTVADARTMIALYHKAYSRIRTWHERLRFTLSSSVVIPEATNKRYSRTLTNCFGREMYFMGPLSGTHGSSTHRAAYSCLPQSTVADMVANAMVIADREMPEVTLKSNNHDSLLFQHYYHTGAGMAAEAARIAGEMTRIYDWMNPELHSTYTKRPYRIATDSKGGLCWGELAPVFPTPESVIKLLYAICDAATL